MAFVLRCTVDLSMDTTVKSSATSHRRPAPRVQAFAILTALVLAAWASWVVIAPFFSVLAWAVVMTVLFFPVHRRIERWLRRPGLAAAVSTLLVILTVLLPTALVATATVAEIRSMASGMPTTVEGWVDPANPRWGGVVRTVERFVSLEPLRNPEFIRASAGDWGLGVASGSLRLVGGAASVLVQMALIVFTMFFLFKDARLVRTSYYHLLPIENQRLESMLVRIRDVINASVYGTLLLAIIQGALGGAAFFVLGLPSPFLWGTVMTLASIIPMLGAFVVWVPAAIFLASTGHLWQAAGLTIWGSVVIGLADNVLRPMLVGSRTRMHELLVLFGVLGGINIFGLLGIVMGPVIFAITLTLIDELRDVGVPDGSSAEGGREEQ
jgi:predicted PurR-regulated permease PerM